MLHTIKVIQRVKSMVAAYILIGLLVTGCTSAPVDQIDLMPAPDVYGDGMLNPLPEDYNPLERIPYKGILFATDRSPAAEEDTERYYLNDRGQVLRVGVANIQFGKNSFDWAMAREISMLKTRTDKYPVKISDAVEWGILGETIPYWLDVDIATDGKPPQDASERFTEAINAQLARSSEKDVYIYVHGYKVVFENPVLVSAELWHFLGYNGVFIAYAWPSTPSKFAYIKDSDTSAGFARNLRLLIESVIDHTDAERIHIIGYSNGTRLVTRAMEQLALKYYDQSADEIYRKLRIENVILLGSDLDRGVFGSYLADGLMNVTRHLTVYLSKYDKALGISQFLTRRERLGQMWGGSAGEMTPIARDVLNRYRDKISFVNVSDAEGADVGNGHGYFRNSPWASSDILMTLTYGLSPEERGLVEQDDLPVFTFPSDYIKRLWDSIEEVDPEFAESYNEFKLQRAEPQ
jgi:esterase/lipase superfamily enzyme